MQKSHLIKILTFVSVCLLTGISSAAVRLMSYSPATPAVWGVTPEGAAIARSTSSFSRNPPKIIGLPPEYKAVYANGSGISLYNNHPSYLYLFIDIRVLPQLRQMLRLPQNTQNTLSNNADTTALGSNGIMIPPIANFLLAEYRSGYPATVYLCRFIVDSYLCHITANSAAPT